MSRPRSPEHGAPYAPPSRRAGRPRTGARRPADGVHEPLARLHAVAQLEGDHGSGAARQVPP
ncbi:hypothetical protein ABZ700_28705, partial [Streptomyces diastaticus]